MHRAYHQGLAIVHPVEVLEGLKNAFYLMWAMQPGFLMKHGHRQLGRL